MQYLKRLGLEKRGYDCRPSIAVAGWKDAAWRGWTAVVAALREAVASREGKRVILAVETYPGVDDEELRTALKEGLQPGVWVDTAEALLREPEAIEKLVEPDLGGEDPIFGRFTRLNMADLVDTAKKEGLCRALDAGEGLIVIYGPAALLAMEADLVVYADLPRWEIQLRQRAGQSGNLGVDNRGEAPNVLYKRGYFIDWRICDRLKRDTLERWDFLLDTTCAGDPRLVTGSALRAGLDEAVRRPFRVVPFFDPGVWGGQWMREICGLPEGPPNFAWCFDCVPEENSLILDFGGVAVEIPALNLVLARPEPLLGEAVYGRFGAEFPIRFDLLDTMGGQNLSFQVHPLIDYAREHFGLCYTQDESYYLLDAEEGAEVYLGLRDGVEATAMLEDLRRAASDPDAPFPDREYVSRFPARRHDHFLIPAGTCHCSGAGSLVLEISHTPYIFTFKLWDWGRLGLDGKPRPLNIDRGAANIRWDRDENWVREHLVNAVEPLEAGDGWRSERTGLATSQFIETRRHWFSVPIELETGGHSVEVLNLVQGAEAVVESPAGAFAPFPVHFAETWIVPAAVGSYRIRPGESGMEHAVLAARVRVQ